MSSTTTHGFPYLVSSDPPDIAGITLAMATESELYAAANRATTVYTTSGTLASSVYPNALYLEFTCVNGGGGSGGNPACSSTAAVSGGGAGGATSVARVAVSSITFPVTITVGAAGAAGSSGTGAGGTGGTSKAVNGATTYCSAGAQNANQGGSAQTAGTSNTTGGTIGFDGSTTGGVGDLLTPGGPASPGIRFSGTAAAANKGGDSAYGFGGFGGASANGQAGAGPGGGAGGAAFISGSATAGQTGHAGIVLVRPVY